MIVVSLIVRCYYHCRCSCYSLFFLFLSSLEMPSRDTKLPRRPRNSLGKNLEGTQSSGFPFFNGSFRRAWTSLLGFAEIKRMKGTAKSLDLHMLAHTVTWMKDGCGPICFLLWKYEAVCYWDEYPSWEVDLPIASNAARTWCGLSLGKQTHDKHIITWLVCVCGFMLITIPIYVWYIYLHLGDFLGKCW